MSKRSLMEEPYGDKFSIPLPKEIGIYVLLEHIEKHDANFYMLVNNLTELAIDLIVSDGDTYIENKLHNIISHTKLLTKEEFIITMANTEGTMNVLKNSVYDIVESLLENKNSYSEYNFIVETIINDRVILQIRKK